MNEKKIQQLAAAAIVWGETRYPKAIEIIPSMAFGDVYLDISLEGGWVREIYYPEDD